MMVMTLWRRSLAISLHLVVDYSKLMIIWQFGNVSKKTTASNWFLAIVITSVITQRRSYWSIRDVVGNQQTNISSSLSQTKI